MDIRYLAGLFDGEGSVNMAWGGRKKESVLMKITVTNSKKDLCNLITSKFGGSVYPKRDRGIHQLKAYEWQLCGWSAIPLLERLLPYVYIKKKAIELALQWKTLYRRSPKPPTKSELRRRRSLIKKLHKVNKRGK